MSDIEISRDKKNPTWAYVWDGDKPEEFTDDDKRIIVDICGKYVMCVYATDEEHYLSGSRYSTVYYENYEIIKEPEYRPFVTIEEYIEATKDRKDFRIIKKDGKILYNGINLHYWITGKLTINGNIDSEEFFNNYVWLDDRSPVGVKCL